MERPCLNNQNEFPDDSILLRYLGNVKSVWDEFAALLKQDYPSITGEWRFYNDGQSWLFKVTRKQGTVCWVSIWDGFFKTTFYFGDKASDLIAASALDQTYKTQFTDGQHYGKIRGVTVEVKTLTDLEAVRELIAVKLKVK